ncbi:MAG: tetratricopeptide repeat protein [Patescibacteria group bacterium]|nr:tetratricopeptide repeat protein [Patescibacteria group bacterium]
MDQLSVLETRAIDAAIANDWQNAIELNRAILELESTNIGALLRLGFAYMQINRNDDAANFYRAALKIQPKNQLALDNLEKIEILEKTNGNGKRSERKKLDPNLFLDVPGKTRAVQLTNLGQKQHLADLYVGQELELRNKKRRLEVRTIEGNYVGTLPDDISKRLGFFLEHNSVYNVYIKEASLSRVLVFIKEVSKGQAVDGYVSFPNSNTLMHHPLHNPDSEGAEDLEDDDPKHEEHDDVWEDDSGMSSDDDDEKTELLHIRPVHDDDDSDE